MASFRYSRRYNGYLYDLSFNDVYIVDQKAGHKQFANFGDSGSGVFVVEDDKPDKALGILVGTATRSQEYLVCKIDTILNILGLEIVRYRENNEEQTLPNNEKI